MMRDLSGAFSGPDRESYTLASVFPPLRRMGSGHMPSPWPIMAEPVPFAGEYPGEVAVGVCRFLLRIHPTDGRSSASCLCIKELIDGSNGLSWHPYAFVWRLSEGVRGNLRAGPDRMGRIALRGGRPGLLRTKTKKTARGA